MPEVNEPQKRTEIHLKEEETAKGLRLHITIEAADVDRTDEQLITHAVGMLARARDEWEQKCWNNNQATLLPSREE